MKIAQLEFAFIAEQDRLLFRMNGENGEEVRAWFTRRLVRTLLPKLAGVLASRAAIDCPSASRAAHEMMVELRREAHLRDMDFATPFHAAPASFPLGEEPFLITRVDLSPLSNGLTRIALKPARGNGMEVNVAEDLLHGFTQMLQEATSQAAWDMGTDFAVYAREPIEHGPRVLN